MSSPIPTTAKSPRRRPLRRPKGVKKGRGPGTVMIGQRIAAADAVTLSIRAYRKRASAGLAEKLSPGLRAGESLPDHGLTLELTARSVEAALEVLLDAHRLYDRQTQLYHDLSVDCDRLAAEELYPRAVKLRRAIDGAFGKRKGVSIHGFQGEVPTWREGLRRQIGRTLLFLEDPKSELPEPLVPGHTGGNRDAWIRYIRPSFETLEEHLDSLARHKLERELSGDARRRAMKAFDVELRQARSAVEAIFTLAGLGERRRRELRAGNERRRMSRWARERRVQRRLRVLAAAAAADRAPGAGDDAPKVPVPGALARVATWLAGRFHRA